MIRKTIAPGRPSYAQATPFEYSSSVEHVVERAPGYRMPGDLVDGEDAIAVWQAATIAVERARTGGGPTLLECMTYRYYGHHQSDDTKRYRLAEEELAARARDCLKSFREKMSACGPLTLEQLDDVDDLVSLPYLLETVENNTQDLLSSEIVDGSFDLFPRCFSCHHNKNNSIDQLREGLRFSPNLTGRRVDDHKLILEFLFHLLQKGHHHVRRKKLSGISCDLSCR